MITLPRTLCTVLILLSTGVYGMFPDSGLPMNLASDLQQKGELVRYFYGDLDLQYLPFGALSDEIIDDLAGQDSTIGVEALFRMAIPTALASMSGKDRDLALFNILNRVSTLSGIEYYSASRERMRTLFTEVYRVKEEGSKKALPDLQFDSIPPRQEDILFQEDLTFGKNYVRNLFLYNEGRFLMQIRNLSTMWYFILPLVKPENFRMNLLIIPQENHIIFYGASSVDSASLFGMEKSKKDSFYNRIKAMQGWFSSQLEQEFKSLQQ
ncbi:DUF6675 family protein [Marispirochaeta sp.]|jgi:hypothetical protein|uniref:DUF6675 family protein n=1 Tax=Marispirochaeta sp. TaxID=2038653 RepID=UPI0029C8E139|nr:DUF6675 family protein [Marispirochaeta sp.]